MTVPKTAALPLGYIPNETTMYRGIMVMKNSENAMKNKKNLTFSKAHNPK